MTHDRIREAFRMGFLATTKMRGDRTVWTFDGPSAADLEPLAWEAWLATLRAKISVGAAVELKVLTWAPSSPQSTESTMEGRVVRVSEPSVDVEWRRYGAASGLPPVGTLAWAWGAAASAYDLVVLTGDD